VSAQPMQGWLNAASAWVTLNFGQPGFFAPRSVNPWLAGDDAENATSFYDTVELRKTLLQLVDFDWLNDRKRNGIRLSVGTVEVETGNNHFFDTQHEILGPEHIMASGALPPALPMVKIGDKYYWDGGIVSNTPLQYLLDQEDDLRTLVFQVDLFSARGALPKQMTQVLTRQKDIVYSSRTRQATTAFKRILSLRRQLADALKRVPTKNLRPGEAAIMRDFADAGVVNLVQLIYQSKHNETDSKDYEFSGSSMRAHAAAGHDDASRTLAMPHWFDLPTSDEGIVEHDIHRQATKR
jgi:NTE family protein